VETETPANFKAAICPHCQASLEGVPALARYCPRCGKAIGAFPAIGQTVEEPAAPERQMDAAISLALLGYSNAMFRLGWRFEHGQGVFRNEGEASRCYAKSAKLGNVAARTRLEEKTDPGEREAPPSGPPLNEEGAPASPVSF
jgi:TPR repeat protein